MTKRYAVVVETTHISKRPTFKIKRYDSRSAALLELDRLEDKYWNSFYNRVYIVYYAPRPIYRPYYYRRHY